MEAPKYTVILQPHGDDLGLNRLLVTTTLESPQRKKLESLCCLESNPEHPPHQYNEENVQATDDIGRLVITFMRSSDGSVDWKIDRDTVGDVILTLEVTPHSVNTTTAPNIETELHCDQGGLIGIGKWFLPRLLYRERSTFLVSWDLSFAPPDTKASWSYGDEKQTTIETGPNELLLSAVFMVGPIMSSATQTTTTGQDHSLEDTTSVVQWFGQLPTCFQPVLDLNGKIFTYTRSVFKDPESCIKVYIRKVPNGFAGHNYNACYLIQYSDTDKPRHESELVRYMTHEMVHNWAFLGNESDGHPNLWFIEGIAEFYALLLPIRAGVKGVDYFRQILDESLTAYYTNPYVTTPLQDVPKHADGVCIPYHRGLLYLLLLDAQLRDVNGSVKNPITITTENPIDSVVLSILEKSYLGESTNSIVWRKTLYQLLCQQTVDALFSDMMNDIVFKPDSQLYFSVAGNTVTLKPIEQEILEFGFSYDSFDTGIIEGLIPGSRAEQAGLQNGDVLISHPPIRQCRLGYKQEFVFVVQRGERRIEGKYWPRSFIKVPSFCTDVVKKE